MPPKPKVRIIVTATDMFLPHPLLNFIELPSIGRLPLFAEVLGQKSSTWIAELIEAREHAHQCLVLLRWMYRPRDLPAKLRNLRDRGKFEPILSDHFGIIDVDCMMRPIEVIDWRTYNGSPPRDQSPQSGLYYFRQTHNCIKKELSVRFPITV